MQKACTELSDHSYVLQSQSSTSSKSPRYQNYLYSRMLWSKCLFKHNILLVVLLILIIVTLALKFCENCPRSRSVKNSQLWQGILKCHHQIDFTDEVLKQFAAGLSLGDFVQLPADCILDIFSFSKLFNVRPFRQLK